MTRGGGSRYAAAALAALTLAACGTTARPSQDPPPAPFEPDVVAIREATAATLAACPCAVDLSIGAATDPAGVPRTRLVGVYDPASRTFDARELRMGVETGALVRVVDGTVYARPRGGDWVAFDYSRLSIRRRAVSTLLSFADPAIVFAVAGATVYADPGGSDMGRRSLSVAVDPQEAAAAAGPWAQALRAWTQAATYADVELGTGRLHDVSFTTSDPVSRTHVALRVTGTGVAAPPVTAPTVSRTVDVANEDMAL